ERLESMISKGDINIPLRECMKYHYYWLRCDPITEVDAQQPFDRCDMLVSMSSPPA
ncbi:hypothetical protein L9F63_007337, partial [Diploptera punctata]